MSTDPSRGLLFAIFAVHLDFVTRDQLAAAIAEWIRQPARPIAAILLDQKAIDPRTKSLVEDVVDRHLEQHQGNMDRSVASLEARGMIPQELVSALGGSITSDAAMPPADDAAGVEESEPVSLAGYASGGTRYRVLGPQDRGGMGEVFVARDLELGRKVLLKQLPDRGADEPKQRASFLKEVRAGAALEHPNIAPVYDIGQYSGGRLFQVMRLIPGGTLQRAIRDHHASPATLPAADRVLRFRELLGHFVDTCQAIEYAHSRGVLHRDIKPNNIMLGSFGETQVIDWGLARIAGHDISSRPGSAGEPLSPEVIGEGSQSTIEGEFKGTPAYASPEQAAGKVDRIDARTDVYGLGATLYCLLTGEAPFRSQSPLLMDDVRKGRFPRPRLLRRDIPPALESICLKAMAHAQEDRYQSPRDLASDVDRWLADEPVHAHPDSLAVRLRRWGLRHRTAVAAAAALLLTSVVGLGIGYAAVKVQRDVAQKNANVAKDVVSAFLLDYVNEVLPAIPQSETKRIEWAGRAVDIGRSLVVPFPEDPGLNKGLARAILELANIQRSVNRLDGIEELYRESQETLERLSRRNPQDDDLRIALLDARCEHLAFVRDHVGLVEAERLARETVAIADRCPEAPAFGKARSRTRWALAEVLASAGKHADACPLMEAACRGYSDVAASSNATVDERVLASLIHAEASRMFRGEERLEEARRFSEAALAIAEGLSNLPDAQGFDRPMIRQVLAEADREWAIDHADDPDRALGALERSIAIAGELVVAHPAIVAYRRLLIASLLERGELLRGIGRFDAAAADATRGVEEGEELIRRLGAEGSPNADDVGLLDRARALETRIDGVSSRRQESGQP